MAEVDKSESRCRRGRPSKGLRKQINLYLAVPLLEASRAKAGAAGMTYTDYVAG